MASWWDYGYQTTAMANRTVIVDNNTWNNTHIATVGTAMSSPEKAAWEIFNSLDVKYVLVVFGGDYSSFHFWNHNPCFELGFEVHTQYLNLSATTLISCGLFENDSS